jgi:phage terminase large subunit
MVIQQLLLAASTFLFLAMAAPMAPMAAASELQNPLTEFIARYRHDRVAFVRDILGVEKIEPWQLEVLKLLDAGSTRISIRSGHGVGKTTLLAWVALHFLFTRYPCKVAVTAPSATQLFDALASEVKLWLKKAEANKPALKGILEAHSDRVFMTAAPEAVFLTYRTSRKENPEALQGIHAEHVLLIADEASGVDEKVFEAAAGSMSTRGAITILAGNPTRATGFFHRTHTVLRHIWKAIRVACFDSSRVDPAYIEEERTFGEDSNRFRIRVLGEFPKGDDDTLIARSLVEDAMKRKVTAPRNESTYWGVDVARSLTRDKSSLAKRKGPVLLEPVKRWQTPDTMQLVGKILKEWEETPIHERPEAIFVDVIGVGGGVLDRLVELELPAVGINVGENPSVLAKAVKLRDELWCLGRDWFMTKVVQFPAEDTETAEELVVVKVAYTSSGNAKVSSKDEMRASGMLGGKSPDGADAFLLTFARTSAIIAGAMNGSKSRKGPLKRKNTRRV